MTPQQSTNTQTPEATTPNQKTPPSRTPASIILFLLLAFPPAAWFFMWRDKTYHHWFGKLLIVSGFLALTITSSSFVAIGAGVDELYASLGIKNTNQTLIRTSTYLSLGFAILQVFFGIYLQQRMKKQTSLSRTELILVIFLLAASFYVAFLPLIFVIRDLYPALQQLYQGAY